MKILLLIISSMFYRAGSHSNQTYYIKDTAVQKLNESIPIFQEISNKMKGRKKNEFNNALNFNLNNFKEMKNSVPLTGEISEKYLMVNFWVNDMSQLNIFKENMALHYNLNVLPYSFISMVISLINNIFKSSTLPKENIEISSNEESNFLTSIRNLFNKNKNKITISVTNDGNKVIFHCYLKENSHNESQGVAFLEDSQEAAHNPNESQEHEEATLIDKKRQ